MNRPATAPPAITAWRPEQDRFRLAVLGKMAEEAGELASRSARCIIQGLDEKDPASGRPNRDELADEIADLQACIDMVRETLSIVPSDRRMSAKANGFRHWHALLEQEQAAGR